MGSPGHLKFAGVQRSPTHILDTSKPTKVLIDHILRFSTCFVSVSARLAIKCDGRMALAFV